MALQRENILGLIGSRRYHSAILTTFSFDFYFFEMKAMRWLRSCGVRNVNVLIDGHYYSELMQQNGGEEMQLAPGYSLYPVFEKSIFHPKIWMLIGDKEGLLIIGSGNLTNAGNGNNEEIWGAFHFDVRQSDNTPIFSAAWSYLQTLCSSIKGYTREKTTKWILDHSPWLKELPKAAPAQFHAVAGKEKIAFLSNTSDSTIWQQLSSLISREKVIEITAMSPYYDLNGKAIKALSSLFPSAKFNVVIDKSGSVPESLPNAKDYFFYDWYQAGVSKSMKSKTEGVDTNSKLHAKIIHFKTRDGIEYCLFGSANVTPEGLGLPGASANSEVSLLIQSTEGNLFNKLGIKLKSPEKLSAFKTEERTNIYESILSHNSYKVKLLSAEYLYDELYLYTEGSFKNPITAKLFDRENRVLHAIDIEECREEMRTKPTLSLEGAHHVELYDTRTDKPISNKILLAEHYILAKTHPNPQNEEIERIYNEIHNGELTRVLDLLPFALNDDTEEDIARTVISGKKPETKEKEEKQGPEKLYDLSSYKPVAHHSLEKGLLLSSLSLRVLDVLKFIKTKAFAVSAEDELRVDEQEEDLGSISGLDERELKIIRNISLHILKTERRKLLHYFEQLHSHQQDLLSLAKNNTKEKYHPTLTDLTRYLIALELLLEFGGKTEKYVNDDKEQYFVYLDFNGEAPYNNDNVKGISLNIIGDFLMLARNGFKEYDFEYTRNKTEQLKFEALTASIVCLLNLRWRESELPYLNTTLLNCLHYMGDKTPAGFNDLWKDLYPAIADKSNSLKHLSGSGENNWNWFEHRIVRAFKKTLKQLEAKDFDTTVSKGEILYKSPWGYCFVKDISKENDFTLSRPGFWWDDEQQDFIKHTDDEVYRPIRLVQFIRIAI
jgi:hypothetical protein